jgi:glycosyltransferase involved in cell wall biosynthesis
VEPTDIKHENNLDKLPRIKKRTSNKRWRLHVMGAHLTRFHQDSLFQGIDVFHATDNVLPLLNRTKSVITLHDLAFRLYPETHTVYNRWFLRIMMPRFLKSTEGIIAVSNSTKRDAEYFYKVSSGKVHVVYPGVGSQFKPVLDQNKLAYIRQNYGLPERYILYVGSIEPRKNLIRLFEAFGQVNQTDIRLVIAGRKGWRYPAIFEQLGRLGLEEKVIFTGFVPDDDLPALYSNAVAFVFPSLYEGFGLPILEAMACGAPVVSSNTSSLPEAAGEAAILIAPQDVQSWVDAINNISRNPQLREELRQKGFRRVKDFSWDLAAEKTLSIYHEIYERFCRSAHRN